MVLAFAPPGRYNTRPVVNAATQAHRERAWVEVDLSTLVHNARTVQTAARSARLLPMVKADAYGLGAVPVARELEALDPWGFGVATVPEGAALRGGRRPPPRLGFSPPPADEHRRHPPAAPSGVP